MTSTESTSELPTVLVTGPSGVIGRAVAEELAGEFAVVGLVHRDTAVPSDTESVKGDLAEERMGLDDDEWNRLAERVDVVVHSGALTTWGLQDAAYEQINVRGTERIVELARAAGAPIVYLSTSFVHAIERDPTLSDLGPNNVVRPYIVSKLAAEKVIEASGLDYVILRPTNLVGDSVTGASSNPQIVQTMSSFICRGKIPFLPAHPGNRLDFIPLDTTSAAVCAAVRTGCRGRNLYWLTYGQDAMSIPQAWEILSRHAATLGRELAPLTLFDPRAGNPAAMESVSSMSRTFITVLVDVSEVTFACGGVLPDSVTELADDYGLKLPDGFDAYERSLEYWAQTDH